jgi:hypothetical protein
MHPSLLSINGVSSNHRTRPSAVANAAGRPPATGTRRCSNYAVAY